MTKYIPDNPERIPRLGMYLVLVLLAMVLTAGPARFQLRSAGLVPQLTVAALYGLIFLATIIAMVRGVVVQWRMAGTSMDEKSGKHRRQLLLPPWIYPVLFVALFVMYAWAGIVNRQSSGNNLGLLFLTLIGVLGTFYVAALMIMAGYLQIRRNRKGWGLTNILLGSGFYYFFFGLFVLWALAFSGIIGGKTRNVVLTPDDQKIVAESEVQPLLAAIEREDTVEIRRLVKEGAELDPVLSSSITDPLSHAAWNGKLEAVKVLVELGDDVNRSNGGYGDTPLFFGAQAPENSREIVVHLIENGADVNKSNSFGVTPFIAFAGVFDVEITRLAIEHGADINSQSKTGTVRVNELTSGTTALMNAAKAGRLETAQLLLRQGADANLVDSKGKSAADYARENGHDNILEPIL